jgi:hypothetical protein
MGIREDQPQGLPAEAETFLIANCILVSTMPCPHCGKPTQQIRKTEECGEYLGMFSNEYSLLRYFLIDGRTADEFEQAAPWSSGPMIFLGLKVSDGTIYKWAEKDIEERL